MQGLGTGVRFSTRVGEFFLHSVQTVSGAYPEFHAVDTGDCLSGVRVRGAVPHSFRGLVHNLLSTGTTLRSSFQSTIVDSFAN
jgi:hypothetical protein